MSSSVDRDCPSEVVREDNKNTGSSPQEENRKENINVNSANNWESADLGDDDRKQKFLRLMGGAKAKPHKGRFIIGETEKPAHVHSTDTEHLSKDLEDQYKQSMEHRQLGGKRGHIGLGFHEEKKEEEEGQEKTGDENGDSAEKNEASEGSDKHDKESIEKESLEADEPCPKKTKLDNPEAS